MAFVASAGSHAYPHDADHFVDNTQHHNPHFSTQHALPDVSTQPGYYNPNATVPHQMACDIKPRLTKEQHDVLEAHYQKQQKPNTNVKKGFAENLGVSLDKVNNWFQNRRAKSKQDAKKHQGALNLYNAQQQATINFSSDSETSPAFSSTEYFNMMDHCTTDDPMSNSISMGQEQPFQDPSPHGMSFENTTPMEPFNGQAPQQQASGDMLFDSPQDMNRRTLTQEQFNALAQNGNAMHASNHYDPLPQFSGDMDVLQQVFPDLQDEFKQQDSFAFPTPGGAPLSSSDSSVPSSISEQSIFPSSTTMQDQGNLSATSSEWGDSRSSSVSLQPQDTMFQQMPAPAPVTVTQPAATSSQWQPGMSQPVDPSALQQQFREAQALRQQQQQQQQANAQAQAQAQAQAHTQTQPHQEQPLAWPADEAFVRRDSQTGAMLAQHMSSFAIQTPLPPQSATFKSPASPGDMSSIAARRQRPRPAALPLSSLRSQSYSALPQPRSPGHQNQQNLAAPGPLRRIRSTNVINGGVAQGRVTKPTPGSAQRSPLNWTFADAMNSPSAARHVSTSTGGNLAPPTPLSPSQEQARPVFPPWQPSAGHFSRQASISETDAEHNMAAMPPATTSQNVSSPPHTPLYHHHHGQQSQQFSQARVGNTVITENTPPQSAPAAQQTFPANVFMVQQQNYPPPQQQSQPPQAPAFAPQQQQPFMNMSAPEQQFQMPAASYGPPQHFVVSAPEAAPAMPIQFANGVPIVNAQGNMVLGFPPQMQQVQFAQHQPQHQMQFPGQPSQMHTPPQAGQYNFMMGPGIPPGMAVNAHMPKPPQPQTEFFVHEYSPPQDMKRSAVPRKPQVDNGPKSYTFANQGPEHFGKDKVKKGSESKSATATSSPGSATSNS